MSLDPFNAGITWLDEPISSTETGPLAGKRLLVKDLVDTAGIRTTYGSAIYGDHVPTRNAVAVDRLLAAGARMVGKASLPEFAWSVFGQSPWYGNVHNPAAPGRTTGGSSSGNAAALAAGLCDIGIGTDTGGSIRLPASCCDVVGLKPRWGAIPLDGVFPLVPTLDTVGPMATTVADVALVWSVLAARPIPEPRLDGLRVGVLRRPPAAGGGSPTDPSDMAEQWVDRLEELGAIVTETAIPDPDADLWPLFEHEALGSHAATFPARADEYTDVCRAKLERALTVRPDAVAAAYAGIEEWRRYEPGVDLYVAPVIAVDLPAEDADELSLRLAFSQYARWVNLLGWAGLAIGNLQLVAPHDETVLAAGLAWERG